MAVAFCGCAPIDGAALTVSVAALLEAETLLESVRRARYSAEPAVAKPLTVNVSVLAPAIPLPSLRLLNVLPLSVEICHCTASDPVPPVPATLKLSEAA